MRQYLDALKYILENGTDRPDRTGIGTRAVFGMQMRYNMADGFPAVTTKKLAFKSVAAELLWFIKGSSDVKELNKLGSRIWDANAYADYWKPKAEFEGDMGRIYGVQWRSWRMADDKDVDELTMKTREMLARVYGTQWRSWKNPEGKTVDQLTEAIRRIKETPYDRRIIITAWNPGELDQAALPPCHALFQFFVANGELSLQMYQRSCDMFLGVPFNIASYSLLLHMVAQVTGLKPGEFVHTLGDAHIYQNHFNQVKEQMSRESLSLPQLWLNPAIKDIEQFTMDDIRLENYQHHPPIKGQMAV